MCLFRIIFMVSLLLVDLSVVFAGEKARLVVVIAVDQLRRDQLDDKMPNGLGRIIREGRNFTESLLNHGITTTCSGHAVMLSGVNPGKAGIPGNSYVDRVRWEKRFCVDDEDLHTRVFHGTRNRSPRNLQVTTLGDWMKTQHSATRVFAVGGKDNGVIPMAGHRADGVFWFDWRTGYFSSSQYYMKALPDYINQFNGNHPLLDGHLAVLPNRWKHLPGSYRPDDFQGESTKNSRRSGHPLGTGSSQDIFRQFFESPYIDSHVISLVKTVIKEERLGADDTTDLLLLALSATDKVGHLYGPRSAESEDSLRNLDEKLGELLAYLDKNVGRGQYLVALTADHGVADLPEWTTAQGRNPCPIKEGRISVDALIRSLYWHIYWEYTFPFDAPENLVRFAGSQISINRKYVEERGLDYNDVVEDLQTVLKGTVGVKKVWNRAELARSNKEVAQLLRNSLSVERSGDLFLQWHFGCVTGLDGTDHGSVYEYDRAVPLIFFGPGVEPGSIRGEAYSVDLAPTLAEHLGIAMPTELDGVVLPLTTNRRSGQR